LRRLLIFLVIIGVLALSVGCGNNDEKKASDNKQPVPATTTAPAVPDAGPPKFKDPEVQKLVDDYTALYKQRNDFKNPEKMVGFISKAVEMEKTALSLEHKLSGDPEEQKKYKAYMIPLVNQLRLEISKW